MSDRNDTSRSPALMILAFAGLGLAVIASGLLVLQHFVAMGLPGCGPGSGCAELAASRWGKVPGLALPVSFVGLAYFIAMTAEYSMSLSRGAPRGLIWIVRLGALASAAFFVLMLVVEKHFCLYCLLAHTGNFLFWIAAEFRSGRAATAARPPLTAVIGLVAGCGMLAIGDGLRGGQIEDEGEQQRQGSTKQILAGGGDESAFTGRWRIGPEVAPIRIVISSDYQCPDCKRIEGQARQVLEQYGDLVSISAKHFPMSDKCNKYMPRDMHGNACWAARAAEAAGLLHGNDGFWKMHFWLFDRGGSFTDAELIDALVDEFGWHVADFLAVMQGPETLAAVEADIEETYGLGLHFTPMVFVNGVEMKGIMAGDALVKTVAEVVATNPQPGTASGDQPPTAVERYIADWAEQRFFLRPVRADAPSMGPVDAPVDVVVWGDIEEPNTVKLHRALSGHVRDRGNVRYRFLHYPVNQSCNPSCVVTKHEKACLAAQVAEAARVLGGDDAFWRVLDWLMTNLPQFDASRLGEAAAAAGVDPGALAGMIRSADVAATIAADGRSGKSHGIRGIPYLWVNQKRVPRWTREGVDVLSMILDAAAEAAAPAG